MHRTEFLCTENHLLPRLAIRNPASRKVQMLALKPHVSMIHAGRRISQNPTIPHCLNGASLVCVLPPWTGILCTHFSYKMLLLTIHSTYPIYTKRVFPLKWDHRKCIYNVQLFYFCSHPSSQSAHLLKLKVIFIVVKATPTTDKPTRSFSTHTKKCAFIFISVANPARWLATVVEISDV